MLNYYNTTILADFFAKHFTAYERKEGDIFDSSRVIKKHQGTTIYSMSRKFNARISLMMAKMVG